MKITFIGSGASIISSKSRMIHRFVSCSRRGCTHIASTMKNRIPSLVTWDIDGTLLKTSTEDGNRAHKVAINEAVYAVHGARITVDDVPHAGSTDLSIIRRMCTAANITTAVIDQEMPKVLRYAEKVINVDSDTSHLVLPGIQKLLKQLSERGIPCALTTGNMAYIADVKLKAAGLQHHFVGGAFGDEREQRSDILRLAVERCAPNEDMKNILHVGDAISDVRAAKQTGARCIAVATGAFAREDLEAEEPDWIFDDLSDTETVLRAFGLN